MMIRSMPPASAHLADRPMPAPPPMTGRPAATWARRRRRHSSRVNPLMAVPHGPLETPWQCIARQGGGEYSEVPFACCIGARGSSILERPLLDDARAPEPSDGAGHRGETFREV